MRPLPVDRNKGSILLNENYEAGKALHAEMVRLPQQTDRTAFGSELQDLGFANVFGQLWTRPGLDRRSRSLITLGVLAALRATEEMEVHFAAARRNGLSIEELEELIYHVTAYAGFPAAFTARAAARRAFAAKENSEGS